MCDSCLSPSVLEYTQLLQALAEPGHPDVEAVFREMLMRGVLPTRVTIKVVEKVLGRRVVKRLLEELNVDETSLGDLVTADFQRRHTLTAPRAKEFERQKRLAYLSQPNRDKKGNPPRGSVSMCGAKVCLKLPLSPALVVDVATGVDMAIHGLPKSDGSHCMKFLVGHRTVDTKTWLNHSTA